MNELVLPSFAKINLNLRVKGKRKDGYHSLETTFQTVDLHDTLTFRVSPSTRFHLILHVGTSEIPADSSNLIYKACHAFHQVYPLTARIEISIDKKIPLESGLGGGSSNAATTLIALARFADQQIHSAKMLSIARQLGSDVAFFLYGGTAFGTGRGDRISELPDWPVYPTLLVHPDVRCSTAKIYKAYDDAGLTRRGNSIKIHLDQRPESLRDLVSRIENDLERVVFALYPELDSIQRRLRELGAVTAALTGSGSTLFALFDSADDLEKASQSFPGYTKTRFVGRSEYKRLLGIK